MRKALLLTVVALLAMAAPAFAAHPHRSARYVGFEGSETKMVLTEVSAKLRVSGGKGRRFRRGSYVKLSCGRDDKLVRKLSLANTRIRRNGTFAKSKRRGRIRYKLLGRFVRRNYAKVTYSASKPSGLRGRCKGKRRKVVLYEKGFPPYTGCRSQHAKNDLKTSEGRFFERLQLDSSEFFPHVYVCLFSSGSAWEIGRNWDDELVEVPRLTAPYAAWSAVQCGNSNCISTVTTLDVASGGGPDSFPASTAGLPGNSTRVTDLALKANRSVAWIVDIGSSVGSDRQVVAVDSAGRRVLDSGGNIDPESLTLSGSTLSWTESGAGRSANLN